VAPTEGPRDEHAAQLRLLADAALALSSVDTVEQAHRVVEQVARDAGDAEWLRQLASLAVQRLEALEGERAARRDAEAAARTYSMLSEASAVFAGSLDPKALVEALTDMVVPRLADWAVLHVLDVDGQVTVGALKHRDAELEETVRAIIDRLPITLDMPYGAGAVLAQGVHQLVPEISIEVLESLAQDDPELLDGLKQVHLRSGLIVPLTARGRTFAALTVLREAPYDDADVAYALDLSRRAALALDNASRFAFERTLAETLQRSLLPRGMPTSALLTSASRYLAGARGTQIGGDWFDLIEVDDGSLVLVVGDVMGRGVHAAAVMGQLRATVRAYAFEGHGPAAMLKRLDRVVETLDDLHFTTCVIGKLEPRTRSLRLSSAGHLPPLVVDPDGDAWFLKLDPGLPLGVGGATYVEQRVVLDPGSLVMLYTDGLVEDRDHPIEYGLERLRKAAELEPVRSPEELCDRVLVALGRAHGDHDDDTALLALLLDSVGAEQPLVLDLPALPESAAPARRALVDLLGSEADADVRDTAALLVTELVTNAARHAGGDLRVRAGVRTDTLLVEVSDASPQLPELVGLPDWEQETGRGLVLVEALADRWGSDPLPTGKRVWFELSVT
jgi:serine phosphatase RsbU (regulator of sigma subunit)/anti-sigma regulatory factor (Ser/Thr protein kinase)